MNYAVSKLSKANYETEEFQSRTENQVNLKGHTILSQETVT